MLLVQLKMTLHLALGAFYEGDGIISATEETTNNDAEETLVAAKENAKTSLMEMKNSGDLTEEELNEFVAQLLAASSIEELEEILAEAAALAPTETTPEENTPEETTPVETGDPLAPQKADAISKLNEMKNNGDLTEAELNEFVAQVEAATSLEEIEDILAEAAALATATTPEETASEETTPAETTQEETTTEEKTPEETTEQDKIIEDDKQEVSKTGEGMIIIPLALVLLIASTLLLLRQRNEELE